MKLVSSSITILVESIQYAIHYTQQGAIAITGESETLALLDWQCAGNARRKVIAASVWQTINGDIPDVAQADQMYKVLVALTQPALAVKAEETPLLPGIPHPDAIPPNDKYLFGYADEIGMAESEVAKWFDHHTARGWMLGKVKMKDWRAALRTWKANGEKWGKPEPADDGRDAVAHVNRLTKDRRGK